MSGCGNGSLYSRADFIYILVFFSLVFCHSVLYMVNQKPLQAASLEDCRISELGPPGVITTPGRQKRRVILNQHIYILFSFPYCTNAFVFHLKFVEEDFTFSIKSSNYLITQFPLSLYNRPQCTLTNNNFSLAVERNIKG